MPGGSAGLADLIPQIVGQYVQFVSVWEQSEYLWAACGWLRLGCKLPATSEVRLPITLPAPSEVRLLASPLDLVVCQVRHEPLPADGLKDRARSIRRALGDGYSTMTPGGPV